MEVKKAKKFLVTRSIRFQDSWTKLLFFVGCAMAAVAVVLALLCLIMSTTAYLGVAVILALLAFIWIFIVSYSSERMFGTSTISFGDQCIKFYSGNNEYRLEWENAATAGFEKGLFSHWVYVSDHELGAEEKKQFPENVKKGVMYYNYEETAYNEMLRFAPADIKQKLEDAKKNIKIK